MKNNKEDFIITDEDVKIDGIDFSEKYARHLKNHPDELKYYKEHISKEYNQTRDKNLLLEGLKIVAMAEGKVSDMAKNANVKRTSVYRMLSKDANPSFDSIVSFAGDVGINFNACLAR
ncbi:MAG: hypothetical protein LBN20_00725 [Endomicrobium sp.]|jgi:DNA-binding phage protein|nr:hypothetical protein [Endomicrobium sp.]